MSSAPLPRRWPLARFGYLYATLVGLVWGAIWSTGEIRRVEGLWVFKIGRAHV